MIHRSLVFAALALATFGCKKETELSTIKDEAPAGSVPTATGGGTATVHGTEMALTARNDLIASLNQDSGLSPFDTDQTAIALTGPMQGKGFGLVDGDTPYMAECRRQGVPIPPAWGNASWRNRGEITRGRVFASSSSYRSVLYTYEPTGEAAGGSCAALPRYNGTTIAFLGIICQGSTGRACFWDNEYATSGGKITDPGDIRPEVMVDGSNLTETCTDCHRGDNVFIVHNGTVLEQIPNRETSAPYTPVGQDGWNNLRAPEDFAEGCQECHTLGRATERYCLKVLMPSIVGKDGGTPTMPPAEETDRADYVAAMREIVAACRQFGTVPGLNPTPDDLK